MQLRAASVSPTRGVWVRYRPRLSGELKPGRSPISTTIARVEQLADFIADRHAPLRDQPSCKAKASICSSMRAGGRCTASTESPSATTTARSCTPPCSTPSRAHVRTSRNVPVASVPTRAPQARPHTVDCFDDQRSNPSRTPAKVYKASRAARAFSLADHLARAASTHRSPSAFTDRACAQCSIRYRPV